MGEELKSRAEPALASMLGIIDWCPTFLEDGGPVHLQNRLLSVLIFLSVAHDGEVLPDSVAGCECVIRAASTNKPIKGIQPTNAGELAVEGGAPTL